MIKVDAIALNENTPVLLAKGPCRVRLHYVAGNVGARIGAVDVTFVSGWHHIDPTHELVLDSGDKLYGICDHHPEDPATATINVLRLGA